MSDTKNIQPVLRGIPLVFMVAIIILTAPLGLTFLVLGNLWGGLLDYVVKETEDCDSTENNTTH